MAIIINDQFTYERVCKTIAFVEEAYALLQTAEIDFKAFEDRSDFDIETPDLQQSIEDAKSIRDEIRNAIDIFERKRDGQEIKS